MVFKSFAAASVAAALAASVTVPANAQQQRVQIGQLACSISAGVGLILGSQRNVSCNFQPDGAPPEAYVGTMTIIGVDIGFTSGSAMVWGVFAGTTRYAGMLSGTYVGATAEMSIAAGLGAKALVGGSNSTVALQPLSVQGQTGLNIAAGVGSLELHSAR